MDRRQRKTREAIFAAFITLLSERDYNQISVQEIIDAADVGRTTFYAHFATRDILLKALCEELFVHIIDSAMGHTGTHEHYSNCSAPDGVFLHLLQHLQKNDNHILDLLSSSNNDIFLRYFKSNLRTLVLSQYAEPNDKALAKLPKDYLINHISATFVETINWWISRNMRESPEELTEYFLTVVAPLVERKTENI